MDKSTGPTMEFANRITSIIYGVVGTFMERTSFGLEESRHAPKAALAVSLSPSPPFNTSCCNLP